MGKNGYTRTQPINFLWCLKSEFSKKKNFQNPKSSKIRMPKKDDAYISSKKKNIISIMPIFNYFLILRKYHAIYNFKF